MNTERPDAKEHNPNRGYVRFLISETGMTHTEIAAKLDISVRSLVAYTSNRTASKRAIPYVIQYAIEQLIGSPVWMVRESFARAALKQGAKKFSWSGLK